MNNQQRIILSLSYLFALFSLAACGPFQQRRFEYNYGTVNESWIGNEIRGNGVIDDTTLSPPMDGHCQKIEPGVHGIGPLIIDHINREFSNTPKSDWPEEAKRLGLTCEKNLCTYTATEWQRLTGDPSNKFNNETMDDNVIVCFDLNSDAPKSVVSSALSVRKK